MCTQLLEWLLEVVGYEIKLDSHRLRGHSVVTTCHQRKVLIL